MILPLGVSLMGMVVCFFVNIVKEQFDAIDRAQEVDVKNPRIRLLRLLHVDGRDPTRDCHIGSNSSIGSKKRDRGRPSKGYGRVRLGLGMDQ